MTRNYIFFLILIFLSTKSVLSQGSAGFFDDRNFFYGYSDGNISKLEYIKIDTFVSSTNGIAYLDNVGNFKLFHKNKKYTILPFPPDRVEMTNFLMAYSRGTFLGVFNGKESKRIQAFFNGTYKVGDSLIAYLDNFNMLKVYTYDTVQDLMLFSISDSFSVSDNIVLFTYQYSELRAFYRNQIMTIENYIPRNYKLARDIIAYNDFLGNFKVFDKGETYTLENYEIENYDVGNGFVAYTNNVGEWSVFSQGVKTSLLSTAPKTKQIKRNILTYTDNSGRFYVFYKGKLTLLENYSPKRVEVWDDIVAYEDLYGSVWGFYKGEKIKISKNIAINWNLQNQCVVYYDLAPSMKTVWNQGNYYFYSAKTDKMSNQE